MKSTHFAVVLASLLGIAGVVVDANAQVVVPLDISGAFNYDAIGTRAEVDTLPTPPPSVKLRDAFGGHNLKFGRSYTNQGSVTDSGTALPDNGVIGNFVISTNFDDGQAVPMQAAPNSIFIGADNSAASATVTLLSGEQAKYSDINFLFVGDRASGSTYQAKIDVTYTDASTATIFDTGLFSRDSSTPGGSFGSGGVGGQGGFEKTTDSDPGVVLAIGTNRGIGLTGSGSMQRNTVRSQTTALWTFASPFALDSSKSLESFTLTTVSQGVNRDNNAWFFAASATTAAALNTLPTLTEFELITANDAMYPNAVRSGGGEMPTLTFAATDPDNETVSFFVDGNLVAVSSQSTGTRTGSTTVGPFEGIGTGPAYTATAQDGAATDSNAATQTVNIVGPIFAYDISDAGASRGDAPLTDGTDNGGATLDIGETIDLGAVDWVTGPTTSTAQLSLSNLFGTDMGALTDLAITSVAISGDDAALFSILESDGVTPFAPSIGNPAILAADGPSLDLLIQLTADGSVNKHDLAATLMFFTDQGAANLGDGAAFQFAVVGVQTPEPASLALWLLGGLGCVMFRYLRWGSPRKS